MPHTHTHTLNFIEEKRNAVMWTDLPIFSQPHIAKINANLHVGSLFVKRGLLFGIQEVSECLVTPRYGACCSWVTIKV